MAPFTGCGGSGVRQQAMLGFQGVQAFGANVAVDIEHENAGRYACADADIVRMTLTEPSPQRRRIAGRVVKAVTTS